MKAWVFRCTTLILQNKKAHVKTVIAAFKVPRILSFIRP